MDYTEDVVIDGSDFWIIQKMFYLMEVTSGLYRRCGSYFLQFICSVMKTAELFEVHILKELHFD